MAREVNRLEEVKARLAAAELPVDALVHINSLLVVERARRMLGHPTSPNGSAAGVLPAGRRL